MGKKNGKLVRVEKKMDFSVDPNVFSDPAMLEAYLDSLGVGNESTPSDNQKREDPEDAVNEALRGLLHEDEDSEDVGATIADMILESTSVKITHPTNQKVVYDENPKVPYTSERPKRNQAQDTATNKPSTSKARSNVAMIRMVHGIKHIVLRDFAGNAISLPVTSGETQIDPENVDFCLKLLYYYRKISGIPAAVYRMDELNERFLAKHIYDADPDVYTFMQSGAFDDLIFVYIRDDKEMDEFIAFMKENLTRDEIADTSLIILTALATAGIMNSDIQMVKWYLETYAEKDELKDWLEDHILSTTHQYPDGNSISIPFSDYDTELNTTFREIGGCMQQFDEEDVDADEEDVPTRTQDDFESFDPYHVTTAPLQKEGEETGASDDVKIFPDQPDETESSRVSGENIDTGRKSDDVGESGDTGDSDVSEDTQHTAEETEERKEDVRGERGNREIDEHKEESKPEVQVGNGHPEIDEVDPDTFKFEEEKEEKNSMVIDVVTVGRK